MNLKISPNTEQELGQFIAKGISAEEIFLAGIKSLKESEQRIGNFGNIKTYKRFEDVTEDEAQRKRENRIKFMESAETLPADFLAERFDKLPEIRDSL